MSQPHETSEEDVLAGNDPGRKRRRAWRDGLANQTVVRDLENIRSYRAFERTLIGSIDPRSVLELALGHRLASLLWRLRRAIAIETDLFEIQSERLLACRQDPSRAPGELRTLPTPTRANSHSKVPRSNNGSPDHLEMEDSRGTCLGPTHISDPFQHLSGGQPLSPLARSEPITALASINLFLQESRSLSAYRLCLRPHDKLGTLSLSGVRLIRIVHQLGAFDVG